MQEGKHLKVETETWGGGESGKGTNKRAAGAQSLPVDRGPHAQFGTAIPRFVDIFVLFSIYL